MRDQIQRHLEIAFVSEKSKFRTIYKVWSSSHDNEKKWLPSTTTTNILEMACYTHASTHSFSLTYRRTHTYTKTDTHTHILTQKHLVHVMEWSSMLRVNDRQFKTIFFLPRLIYHRPFHRVIFGHKIKIFKFFSHEEKKPVQKNKAKKCFNFLRSFSCWE